MGFSQCNKKQFIEEIMRVTYERDKAARLVQPLSEIRPAFCLLVLAYWIASHWAVNRTIYANKVVFYRKPGDLFIQKTVYALFCGWFLIPVALIKKLLGH